MNDLTRARRSIELGIIDSIINDPDYVYDVGTDADYTTPLTDKVHSLMVGRTSLRPMGEEGTDWYFDCDGHYIDINRDSNGKYSVFFRNRSDQSEAWLDQAENKPQLAFLEPLYRWMARARFERPEDEAEAAKFAGLIKAVLTQQANDDGA